MLRSLLYLGILIAVMRRWPLPGKVSDKQSNERAASREAERYPWLAVTTLVAISCLLAAATVLLTYELEHRELVVSPTTIVFFLDPNANAVLTPQLDTEFLPEVPRQAFSLNLMRDDVGHWSGEVSFVGIGGDDLWTFGSSSGSGSIFLALPPDSIVSREGQTILGRPNRCAQWREGNEQSEILSSEPVIYDLESAVVVECPLPRIANPVVDFFYQVTVDRLPVHEAQSGIARSVAALEIGRTATAVPSNGLLPNNIRLDSISTLPVDMTIGLSQNYSFVDAFPEPSTGSIQGRIWEGEDSVRKQTVQVEIERFQDRSRAESALLGLTLATGGLLSATAGVATAPLISRTKPRRPPRNA